MSSQENFTIVVQATSLNLLELFSRLYNPSTRSFFDWIEQEDVDWKKLYNDHIDCQRPHEINFRCVEPSSASYKHLFEQVLYDSCMFVGAALENPGNKSYARKLLAYAVKHQYGSLIRRLAATFEYSDEQLYDALYLAVKKGLNYSVSALMKAGARPCMPERKSCLVKAIKEYKQGIMDLLNLVEASAPREYVYSFVLTIPRDEIIDLLYRLSSTGSTIKHNCFIKDENEELWKDIYLSCIDSKAMLREGESWGEKLEDALSILNACKNNDDDDTKEYQWLLRACGRDFIEYIRLVHRKRTFDFLDTRQLHCMLCCAVDFGAKRATLTLVELGIPLRYTGYFKQENIIHVATKANQKAIVKALLKTHPDLINEIMHHDKTPLHIAICNEDLTIAKLLLDAGADRNAIDSQAQTPLIKAIEQGNVDAVHLLKPSKEELNSQSSSVKAPLSIAVRLSDPVMIQVLLLYGADVAAIDRCGDSYLHKAAYEGKLDNLKLLLSYADLMKHDLVNIENKNGLTVLDWLVTLSTHIIVMKESILTAMIELLIDYGAKFGSTTAKNSIETAVDKYFPMLKKFIDAGIIDLTEPYALHNIAICRKAKLSDIKSFFTTSSSVRQKDKDGNTALHLVAMCLHSQCTMDWVRNDEQEIIHYLVVLANKDPDDLDIRLVRNKRGKTAADCCGIQNLRSLFRPATSLGNINIISGASTVIISN